MKFDNVQYFVFCSNKTGSTTLYESLRKKFGDDSVMQAHGDKYFKKRTNSQYGNLKDLVINNSKKFNKIYIIDSYREPIDRCIALFFQDIYKHCPNWRSMTVDDLINFFNEKKYLYFLDSYHSYQRSWGYFDISTDVKFDFEKGYITRQQENIVFVKTRLKEAYRWDKIFSEIFNTDIKFDYHNDSKNKDYYNKYLEFKEKYKLPIEVKKQFLYVTKNSIKKSWYEMMKFMTKEEIKNYLERWELIKTGRVGFEPTVGFPTSDFKSDALDQTQPSTQV
jgi:hypothetical protein